MWFLKKLDWWVLGPVLFLSALGLLMQVSLSSRDPEPFFWFWRQFIWLLIGILVFTAFSLFDYRIFKNSDSAVVIFYLITLILLVLVLFLGKTISGSRAWFELGSFTFQPVEFAKVALLLVLAKYFAQKNIEIWHFKHLVLSGLWLLLPLGLVLAQPDWGSGLTLIILWFGMVLLAGARGKQVVLLAVLLLLLGLISWFSFFSEAQKARITTLFRPELDPYGSAYNQRQAIVAIGSGGLWGKGLGKGTQAQLKFLPASRTDFIFASIAEELGFLGVIVLLSAFAVLFFEIARIVLSSDNNFARLFSLGFLILLTSHVFINLGMNLGILPVIGITLPFVSYGGSSLVSLFLLLGILTSIRIRA